MPRGLGRTEGGRLWKTISSAYELRPDEERILEDACRVANVVDRLDRVVVKAELTVDGSMGQKVPHPLLGELRAQRHLLGSLLKQLKIPDHPLRARERALDTSSAARRAASTRWQGGAA